MRKVTVQLEASSLSLCLDHQHSSSFGKQPVLTSPGVPVRPIYPISVIPAVTKTARIGTPDLQARSLLVINSGPVWSCKAKVCSTLEATYMELIAHVKDENTKIALKKCAAAGSPASTTAIMNGDLAPTDWAFPLMNGWSLGTTNDTVSIASA